MAKFIKKFRKKDLYEDYDRDNNHGRNNHKKFRKHGDDRIHRQNVEDILEELDSLNKVPNFSR